MIRRAFSYLIAAAVLLAIWALLAGSLSPGTLLIGTIVALAAAWTFRPLDLPPGKLRSVGAALRLAPPVLAEIVRSNFAVFRIIVSPRSRELKSGFVRIPLEMRTPYGLTALACIITATPGTVWVEYESVGNTILLHVLDLIDEEEWVRIVKERYERPLMEIFG